MKRFSIARRSAAIAIACGMLGIVMMAFFGRIMVRNVIRSTITKVVFDTYQQASYGQCVRDPATWRWTDRDQNAAFAYDADTLLSKNPSAPSLERRLVEAAMANPDHVAVDNTFGHGSFVFLARASGECAIVQGTWTRTPTLLEGLTFALTALVVGGGAAAIAFLVTVRPLMGRIHRLRLVADRIGEPSETMSPPDDDDGELSVIEAGMVRAHGRILTAARTLSERHRSLERHLADVAHDLRTPLSSLQLALEHLASIDLGAEGQKTLNGALRDVVYVAGLSANLRLASRLEEGWTPSSEEAPVDLVDVVNRAVERLRFLAMRKNIELAGATPDGALFVSCAYVAIERTVSNIVDNAIAYGDENGHVAVQLREVGDSDFLLEVLDDGPGVVPSEIPRLVDRNYRSELARERDPKGGGLGLAIVSEVCAQCGFSLAITALEPRGMRVAISGPRVARPPAAT